MNNSLTKLEQVSEFVKLVQPQFNELAEIHKAVNFKEEASYAIQILKDNPYLCGIAYGNPDSLKRAVIHVAAVGLSLNPYKKQAYLVPRKDKVCLEISYVGYIQLALDCKSIRYAVAEIVHENDIFIYNGPNKAPSHRFDPFGGARGRIVGVYVLAETLANDMILTHMALDEIHRIRDRSESWIAYKKKGTQTPWYTDETEMYKKTGIRRARKSWPMTNTDPRMEKATELFEDQDIPLLAAPSEHDDEERKQLLLDIRQTLETLERGEKAYIDYLVRIHRRSITALEDMTKSEMRQSLAALAQMIEQKKKGGK